MAEGAQAALRARVLRTDMCTKLLEQTVRAAKPVAEGKLR
jgi:hypothetical protein